MMGKTGRKLTLAVLVGVAGVMAGGTKAMAKSVQLELNGVDAGWKASWNDDYDDYIDISVDRVDLANCTVYIEKSVNFTDSKFWNAQGGFYDPAVIAFHQTDPNGVWNIVINDEQITNNTSQAWDSFRMFLMGGATFDPAQSANFNVGDEFTNKTFTNDPDGNPTLNITDGSVAVGDVWFPGAGSNPLNQLWINANAGRGGELGAFTLKEQPHAIPLPAAAWSGLSGLVGLALLGSRKKLRSLIA